VLAWLGLVSYSVYLLHPVLIEIYDSVPWTRNENFVPMELLMTGVFLLVLLVSCGLAHRFIETPMQRRGRLVARWLDARFELAGQLAATIGPASWPAPPGAPAPARSVRPATQRCAAAVGRHVDKPE
jgi:peptidoglycan/LPS O-acetylase OafA/YrhL